VRFTLDSNILVYAVDVDATDKHRIANDLLIRAPKADAVLTAQALAEFLAVVRRKYPRHLEDALEYAESWSVLFPVAHTGWVEVAAAARLSRDHGLQIWDCIIWQAARSLGASVFVSEDLQDGLTLAGMTVLDPFKAENKDRLARLLEKKSGEMP
jgi:predicted nucleic acid-binding protein